MKWIGKHPVYSDLLIDNVFIQTDPAGSAYDLTLPPNDGSSGQVLTTDGSGVLTWTTPSSGGPDTNLATTNLTLPSTTTRTFGLNSGIVDFQEGSTSLLKMDGGAPMVTISELWITDLLTISNGANAPELRLREASGGGSSYGELTVPALASNRTYTFPDATGTVALTSDIPGGTGVSMTDGVNDRIMTATAAQAIKGESTLTYDGSLLKNTITPGGTSSYGIWIDSDPTSDFTTTGVTTQINLRNTFNKTTATTVGNNSYGYGSYNIMSDTQTNAGTAHLIGTYNNINHTGAVGTGQTWQYGVQNVLAGDTTGTMGVRNQILTGNNIYGVYNQLKDDSASHDLYFKSADNTTADYFSLRTGASGATIIETVDADVSGADLTFDVDGEIVLDVHTNEDIFFKENGAERFHFHMDATPRMDVTGSFRASSTGTVEIIGTGGCSVVATGATGDININADGGDVNLWKGADYMAQFTTTNVTLGKADASQNNISKRASGAGVSGGRLGIAAGDGGSGSNISGGAMEFTTGICTGAKDMSAYTFFGGINTVALGGSATDIVNAGRPAPLWSLHSGPATTPIDGVYQAFLHSPEDPGKYLNFKCGWYGYSTISTYDGSSGTTLADLTFDIDGDIVLAAKGGEIGFKDSTSILATIDTNGLSFQDNTGAGIKFEGATNNANQTTLSVIDPTNTRTINLPDENGTVALKESQTIHVDVSNDRNYLFYAYNGGTWYGSRTASSSTGTFCGSSPSVSLYGSGATPSTTLLASASCYAGRIPCYVAPEAVELKKLRFSFYWYSSTETGAHDLEFNFQKYTLPNSATLADITRTDVAASNTTLASFTEYRAYTIEFVFTPGSNAELAAGDALQWCMRSDDVNSDRIIVYGSATLSLVRQ